MHVTGPGARHVVRAEAGKRGCAQTGAYPMHRGAVCQDANSAAMDVLLGRVNSTRDAGPITRRVRTTQAATGINITGANGTASEQSGMEDDRGGDDSCRGSALSSTSIWQGRLTIYPDATGV